MTEYDHNAVLVGISFKIGTPFGPTAYSLPCDVAAVNKILDRQMRAGKVPRRLVTTEQAAAIDPDYKGKGLQVQFTVNDKTFYTMAWGGAATYRKAGSPWVENVCAENTNEYYRNTTTKVPEAERPDF